jgi:hypothetical protein
MPLFRFVKYFQKFDVCRRIFGNMPCLLALTFVAAIEYPPLAI